MTIKRLLIAILVFGAAGAGAWQAGRGYNFNIDSVAISGEISASQRAEVFTTLLERRGEIDGMRAVKKVLEQASWIHHVDVIRDWPDRLIVSVHEEKAIAYWNEDAYINDEGRVFRSPYVSTGPLAQLYGPPDQEREVMQQYLQLGKALSKGGQDIDSLRLDERGSWEFTTDRKIRVLLGKEDIMERIQRLLVVVESAGLAGHMEDIEQIDTRYPNGLSVSWKEGALGLELAKSNNLQRESRL